MNPSEAEALYQGNQGLAFYFSKAFHNGSLGRDDAVQVAQIALWQACLTFDPDKGSLAGWAGAYIRNALRTELTFHLRHFPTSLASLDQPVAEETDTTLGDLIADRHDAYSSVIETDVARLLARCSPIEREVIRLRWGVGEEQASDPPTTDQHGSARGALRTHAEVGAVLNVSRQRVQQIEVRAQARMRGTLTPFVGRVRLSKASRALQLGKPGRGWLTTAEAASYLEKSRRQIVLGVKTGRIKGEKVGTRWRVSEDLFA